MAELVPAPFSALVRRAFAEYRREGKIFDLPARKFFTGSRPLDTSVLFHGERASSPLGPAAGPQTQMAQNIVLSWLAGARILELKTVQINDRLEILRPCIDARTVGYNIEWSQELRLEQSLREYAAAWALIAMLRAEGIPSERAAGERGDTIFDLSVGYDLAGISSDRVRAFLSGAADIGPILEELRGEIPPELAHLRRVDVPRRLSSGITLSTFHGCPAGEIEAICRFLLDELGFHVVVKLNPTLLGLDRVREILDGTLGYGDVVLSPEAFDKDLQWDQAAAMIPRLQAAARRKGLGFGVKLTNTLVVENRDRYFKDPVMYLSGAPLHVITMQLARKMRETFGDALPISFSAGVDRTNFPDVAALGFVPVTTCTDLLKPGGYGRLAAYMTHLEDRMEAAGARTLDEFILRREGRAAEAVRSALGVCCAPRAAEPVAAVAERGGDLRAALAAWAGDAREGDTLYRSCVARAALMNTKPAAERVAADPRYGRGSNSTGPRKIGSKLALFDCINCDKCIPVCPNDAMFSYETRPAEIAYRDLVVSGGAVREGAAGVFRAREAHQLAVYSDFCNECGNCDVFCPEDGGPYLAKPRFFGSMEQWEKWRALDGFVVESREGVLAVRARLAGTEYALEFDSARGSARVTDGGIEAVIDLATHAVLEARALPSAGEGHTLALGGYHAARAAALAAAEAGRANPLTASTLAIT